MKTWCAGLAVLSVAAVAGCARPAGADGNLVDDWPKHGDVAIAVPVAGTCDPDAPDSALAFGASLPPRATDCAAAHKLETYFVGTLTGQLAQMGAPPNAADSRDVFAQCGNEATKFLGGDWRTGRVRVMLMVPSSRAWTAGARFFRCDLAEVSSDRNLIVARSGSLKGGLAGDRPLANTCGERIDNGDQWRDTKAVPCNQPHNVEFVAHRQAPPRPYPDSVAARRLLFDEACNVAVSQYLGMSLAQLAAHRQIYASYWTEDQVRWDVGDRTARCYVVLRGTLKVNRSLKGVGNTTV